MTLLERVKAILYSKGMSFTALAEKMGASRSSLYQSIQSESVRYSTLEKMTEALQIKLNTLMEDPDIPNVGRLLKEKAMMIHHLNSLCESVVKYKVKKIEFSQLEIEFKETVEQMRKVYPEILSMEDLERLHLTTPSVMTN